MNPAYPSITPAIVVHDGAKALDFYKAAFGAEERYRMATPGGGVGHAEFTIGGQLLMLGDEMPGMNKSPLTLGGVAGKLVLQVENTDAAFNRAVEAGATPVMQPADQFYGWRMGIVRDPFGHEWMIQHEVETVAPEEMERRWQDIISSAAKCGDGPK